MKLIDMIGRVPALTEWGAGATAESRQLVTGLSGSAKTLAMAQFYQEKQAKVLILSPNLYYASHLVEDLRNVVAPEDVYYFPVNEITSAEMAFASPEARAERIEALSFLASDKPGIVVVPTAGIKRMVPNPAAFRAAKVTLTVGEEFPVSALTTRFLNLGYRMEPMVEKPGEFSVRGSIFDIYPLDQPYPLRFDFFDDEVDSIRTFDPETQRSLENQQTATIVPATDLFVEAEQLKAAGERFAEAYGKHLAVTPHLSQSAQDGFTALISDMQEGKYREEWQLYADFLYPKKHSILDYLTAEDHLFVDDYSRMLEAEREIEKEEAEWVVQKLEEEVILPQQRFSLDVRDQLKKGHFATTYFALFQKGLGNLRFQAIHVVQQRAMQQFFGQMPLLKSEIERWQKRRATVVVLAQDQERARKLEEMLLDIEIPAVVHHDQEVFPQQTQIMIGQLQDGFELPEDHLVVVLEKEIIPTKTRKKMRKQNISNAERLKDYNELKPGDYVVHVNHGIGKYIGMETLVSQGVHQDYMTILYQNNDKLFIPVTQLDLIQKYVASESKVPKINRLGGAEWTKTKRKVSEKIEDIADDLIQLYAEREAQKGFAFSPDNDYQREFEDAFPYSETEDQLRSTAEIKRDMEKDKPMDRLLVGDVGYGKTEVALRAAFKAIQDGKQVAVLVPTTILAQQHYDTMRERFADFPVEVGLLSRFRTRKQQEETIAALQKGQVDIVVGTHRLLSQDVAFQDIGLLIIDEEQRFGVKHKERVKQLRAQVDVLTLTATPIPRTLHMSMLGVRDLSVIETPPANRYPVQTYVMEQNPGAVREAIERELGRGGQVFYLYNRVETITKKVEELRSLVPDARIAHAHGQMTEVQLENILMDFIHHEYDVLVTTTIIETGVDIPNVNTLFVENADYMGLSQLYQLRGRVGRSNRVAYAYFMYEAQKVLNEVSEKRLQAIKDFTELGSGFKIAMRDLSIRGAGNLLGAQQHGFIDSVGFDLYSQMLSEAVARKRGETKQEPKTVVEIDLGIDAYLPESYISDERQKIEIYKRIRQMDSEEMYEEIEQDLLDRFGEFGPEVANLLTIGQLKMSGEFALIEKIAKQGQVIHCTLSKMGTQKFLVPQIFEALSATKLKAALGVEDEKMRISLTIEKNMPAHRWLHELVSFVQALWKQKYQVKQSR